MGRDNLESLDYIVNQLKRLTDWDSFPPPRIEIGAISPIIHLAWYESE